MHLQLRLHRIWHPVMVAKRPLLLMKKSPLLVMKWLLLLTKKCPLL
jgi:hypothetical protein